jgi:hypothetical protein
MLIDFDPTSETATRFIPGSTFRNQPYETITKADGPFDAIIMSQVLEHAIDPSDWVRRAADLLRPGGALVIALPNFAGLYRLLGARDPFICPPVHLNYFTADSMKRLVECHGLQVKFMRSASRVSLHRAGGGELGVVSRLMRAAWNLASAPLDYTSRGIVLRCVCVKPLAAASPARPFFGLPSMVHRPTPAGAAA